MSSLLACKLAGIDKYEVGWALAQQDTSSMKLKIRKLLLLQISRVNLIVLP